MKVKVIYGDSAIGRIKINSRDIDRRNIGLVSRGEFVEIPLCMRGAGTTETVIKLDGYPRYLFDGLNDFERFYYDCE